MKKGMKVFKGIVGLLISIFMVSCNDDFPNLLKEDYGTSNVGAAQNKVLVVVVDGVRGNALADIDPENLRELSKYSFYTNSSLGDYEESKVFTKATGFANIFTGVTSAKHLVTSDLSTVNTAVYPTIFERLASDYEGFNSKAFTTDADLKNTLFKTVNTAELLTSDEQVLEKTKEAIKGNEGDMIVAHLSDVEKVGKANSFETNNANYKNAILKLDDQLEDLINTLESRPTYKDENWLVVFTSSIGGDIDNTGNTDQTIFADNKRNTFTYFYSPRFARKYQAKPSTSSMPFIGAGLSLQYGTAGENATSARLDDKTKLNFSGTQNLTITFFFKQSGTSDHNYPTILSKRKGIDDGNGWQFIMAGGMIQFGGSGSNKINTATVKDEKWHAITAVVNRTANTVKVYTDGVLSNQTTAGTGSWANDFPMVWGRWVGSASGNFTVCNLQIYDVAMTDTQVKDYAGIALVKPANSPLYNNLIGYWPAYGDNGRSFVTDVTAKTGNLKIYNEPSWTYFDEYVSYFTPDINESTYKIVPNQVDIPFFIYQWFGIIPKEGWKLDGQSWTPPYRVLEY